MATCEACGKLLAAEYAVEWRLCEVCRGVGISEQTVNMSFENKQTANISYTLNDKTFTFGEKIKNDTINQLDFDFISECTDSELDAMVRLKMLRNSNVIRKCCVFFATLAIISIVVTFITIIVSVYGYASLI